MDQKEREESKVGEMRRQLQRVRFSLRGLPCTAGQWIALKHCDDVLEKDLDLYWLKDSAKRLLCLYRRYSRETRLSPEQHSELDELESLAFPDEEIYW